MSKLSIVKGAINIVVGLGTSKIVADIIRNNTNPTTVVDKVSTVSAAFVIGSMVGDATKEYTDAKIDEIVAWWNEHVKNPQPQN